MTQSTQLTRYEQAELVRAKLRYTPKAHEPATTIITAPINDHLVQITLAYKASEIDLVKIIKATKDLEDTLRTLDIPANKAKALQMAQHDASNRIKYLADHVTPAPTVSTPLTHEPEQSEE